MQFPFWHGAEKHSSISEDVEGEDIIYCRCFVLIWMLKRLYLFSVKLLRKKINSKAMIADLLPISQLLPSYPAVQLHQYPFMSSVHAPFWHGEDKHSSEDMEDKNIS